MGVKISLDEIKQRLYKIFGDKYEYDFTDFVNTHSKIGVRCNIHGWSNQILKNLFKGHGCNRCGNKVTSDKQKSNFNDVLTKFRKIHGDKYDYSKFNYTKNRNDSIIICPLHGEFNQSPWTHIKGHGCPSCSKNKRFTKEDFINASKLKQTKSYIYDFVDYKNAQTKVKIICPDHGEFYQNPQDHIRGQGCPKCNQSKGEKMIEKFLIENNIKYVPQKKFDGCKYVKYLVFDFYLPDYNTCVEFNGIQHYYPIERFGGDSEFDKNKIRDKIKDEFCENNNIKLIIIKQDKKHIDVKDVEDQILNLLNSL